MSLVIVKNTGKKIEMNNLEYISWKDGWNGGGWNNWGVINEPHNYSFYAVNSDEVLEVEVVVNNISGVDSDMGKKYSWESKRLYVKDCCKFGTVLIDSQKLSNDFKIMYCNKEV